MAESVKLTIEKIDALSDWYVLRRVGVEPNGRDVPTQNGFAYERDDRIEPRSDVEGTAAEWLAIADGITGRMDTSFRRCEVVCIADGMGICSPRNSNIEAPVVTLESADCLAAEIRRVLCAVPEPVTDSGTEVHRV